MSKIVDIISALTPYAGPREAGDDRVIGMLSTQFSADFTPATSAVALDPRNPESVDVTTAIAGSVGTTLALAIASVLNSRVDDKVVCLPSSNNEGPSDLVISTRIPSVHIEQAGLEAILKRTAVHGMIGVHLTQAISETPRVKRLSRKDEKKAAITLVENALARMLESVKG